MFVDMDDSAVLFPLSYYLMNGESKMSIYSIGYVCYAFSPFTLLFRTMRFYRLTVEGGYQWGSSEKTQSLGQSVHNKVPALIVNTGGWVP